MRSVLFIAYLFPPLGGPGVQRTLSFARHLPAFGFRPEIVCAEASPDYWARDETLLARVPAGVGVHRVAEGWPTRAARLARRAVPRGQRSRFDRFVFVPDRQALWGPAAARRAVRVGRRTRAELVFATGAPWTNLLVGAWVARRLRLPLVADFRDPWTDGSVFRAATSAHAQVHRSLEGLVHREAASVVANSAGNLADLKRSFDGLGSKAVFIPNGWEADDFAQVGPPPAPPGDLRLGYAGNFYPGRGLREVLELLARARDAWPRLKDQLRLRFIGHTEARVAATGLGLEGVVEELGYRPLQEALALLGECHATLVTVPRGARAGWVPQKLYQQLRLGRPVVTLAPPGEAADITQQGQQWWIDVERSDAGVRLGSALEAILDGAVRPVPTEVLRRYERSVLAGQLAEVFERVLAARPVSSS